MKMEEWTEGIAASLVCSKWETILAAEYRKIVGDSYEDLFFRLKTSNIRELDGVDQESNYIRVYKCVPPFLRVKIIDLTDPLDVIANWTILIWKMIQWLPQSDMLRIDLF